MTLNMTRKFAWQNLKANRLWEIPFVLSSGIMFILFNIMVSLADNTFVQTRHSSLPMLISFAIIVIGIFAAVFTLYATQSLIKRRHKEFALYGILGLEKKHIRRIIGMEFFMLFTIIALMAIPGGYIFGQLTFLGLNRLMNDMSGSLMDYPFSPSAMGTTAIVLATLYLVTLMRSSWRIYVSTPIQLIGHQQRGEGEPKSRTLLMILGFFLLGTGYTIALITEDVLSALTYFFLAALLVIFATYLLYVSFSVIILKHQKRQKSYYQPSKFLRVSGLLYRMQSNAVSLASISLLSTMLIITLSSTAAIYASIEHASGHLMPREYQIKNFSPISLDQAESVGHALRKSVEQSLQDPTQLKNVFVSYESQTAIQRQDHQFLPYTNKKIQTPDFLFLYDLAGYNERTRQQIQLADNEILLCSNQDKLLEGLNQIQIGQRKFTVRQIKNIIPSKFATSAYGVVVKDLDTMQYIARNLPTRSMDNSNTTPAEIRANIYWDVKNLSNTAQYNAQLQALQKNHDYLISIRDDNIRQLYEMNGGFLFLGIVIGLIFLTGTVLISYYKQISEGYEDREKYKIMKKVGLPDALIKKTGASQIMWMFFAPLLIATIHCCVAAKIVYELLGLFGLQTFADYGIYLGAVILIFFIFYFIIFKLTSKAYYHIVH